MSPRKVSVCARVIWLHWLEQRDAVQEATLEVEHLTGERQLFVVPVLRMTDRLPASAPRDKGVTR